MNLERDDHTVGELLEIPRFAPLYTGWIDRDPNRFHDWTCDECGHGVAVYVQYTVDEPGEGYVSTAEYLCAEHAGDGVRVILDREDRSHDHGVDITVNKWAKVYGAFQREDARGVAA